MLAADQEVVFLLAFVAVQDLDLPFAIVCRVTEFREQQSAPTTVATHLARTLDALHAKLLQFRCHATAVEMAL